MTLLPFLFFIIIYYIFNTLLFLNQLEYHNIYILRLNIVYNNFSKKGSDLHLKLNNKLISRVYDYRQTFESSPTISYDSRKLDDSLSIIVKPPLEQKTMEYIIKNSSMVRKCSDILAKDILYNNIEIEAYPHWYYNNREELYYLGLDYYCTGYAICRITDDEKNIQQIPSVTCVVIRDNDDYYLKQALNGKWFYYNIYGVTEDPKYEETVYMIGGDNLYSFYTLPKYFNCKEEVFTDILLSERNFKHVENNFIPISLLRFNLAPNFDNEENKRVITDEMKSAEGGTAVLFTENETKQDIDYIRLEDSSINDTIKLNGQAERSILNMYNIPLERLLINENKESMNSNKFSNIWEIYINNLRAESKVWLNFITDLLELDSDDEIIIDFPVFSDNKSTELENIIKLWTNNLIPYGTAINMLREHYPELDVGLLENSFKDLLNNELNGATQTNEVNNGGFNLL